MDSFSKDNSANIPEKSFCTNEVESENCDTEKLPNRVSETSHAVELLLVALYNLAADTALMSDIDPDYVMVKALLEASLQRQINRYEIFVDSVLEDYEWLNELLQKKN